MNKDQNLSDMEILFLGLADKTRLRLLNIMRNDEICVNLFIEILDESQPKISRHLAYLRNAKIVETRRDGKQIYYRLIQSDDKSIRAILESVFDWLNSQPQMQREYFKFLDENSTQSYSADKTSNISQENIYVETDTSTAKAELDVFLL